MKFIIEVILDVIFYIVVISILLIISPESWENSCYFIAGWWTCMLDRSIQPHIEKFLNK